MNITYPELVRRLAKPGADILAQLDAPKCHLLHMAVGVSGEAAELLQAVSEPLRTLTAVDRANVVEELGDAEFYLEGLRAALFLARRPYSIEAEERERAMLLSYAINLAVSSGDLLDRVKKHVICNKPLVRSDIEGILHVVDGALEGIRLSIGVSRDEVLEANQAKLAKRYSDLEYSDAAAQRRADKEIDSCTP